MISPLPPMQSASPWTAHSVRINAITPEIPGVATYHLQLVAAAERATYSCLPGQFNMLYLPGVGEVAISVSGHSSATDTWAHTIRTAGRVTQELARYRVGEQLGWRGPFGTSWPMDACRGRDVVLLAGGIGLAPLRPAIDAILADRNQFGRATLIYGARTPETLLYPGQYADWVRAGLDVRTTVDRATPGWRGNVGVVPMLFDRLRLLSAENTIVLSCGPEVMMRYAVRSALDQGIPATQIWLSLERNMQCAVGFCGHCQLGPAFICKDGPVFRHDRIAPFLGREDL
jgi:NAD(P)H-flavin reductase